MIDYCFSLFLEVTVLVVILYLGLMIFLNVPSPGNPEVPGIYLPQIFSMSLLISGKDKAK